MTNFFKIIKSTICFNVEKIQFWQLKGYPTIVNTSSGDRRTNIFIVTVRTQTRRHYAALSAGILLPPGN